MATEDAALLETHGLELRAGSRTLVTGLDWRAGAGEFWCILGSNGAGKTTLLRALAGLVPPAGGTVQIEGRPIGAGSGVPWRGCAATWPSTPMTLSTPACWRPR